MAAVEGEGEQGMLVFTAHGTTDTGHLRSHNEDCFSIDESNQIFIVADGMGGHNK